MKRPTLLVLILAAGSFHCTAPRRIGCESGYEESSEGCENIDECGRELDDCDPLAICVDTAGSFRCECPEGFSGDGRFCELAAIDCSLDETICPDHSSCTPVDSTRHCICDAGYERQEASCLDIDGCAASPCFDGVACTDVPAPDTGFVCGACPSGYAGDGIACVDVNECETVPDYCASGFLCQNSRGGAHCVEDPDRDGDGVENDTDNCPNFPNPDQADVDGDFLGDACDVSDDRDLPATVDGPAKLYFVAIHQADSLDGQMHTATLRIRGAGRIVLVLSSYGPVRWDLFSRPDAVQIDRVIVNGHYDQEVIGLSSARRSRVIYDGYRDWGFGRIWDAPVEEYSVLGTGVSYDVGYPYELPSREAFALMDKVKQQTGLSVVGDFQTASLQNEFLLEVTPGTLRPEDDFDGDGTTNGQDCAPADPERFSLLTYHYRDVDGDGYVGESRGLVCSDGVLPAGYFESRTGLPFDCDESDATVHHCADLVDPTATYVDVSCTPALRDTYSAYSYTYVDDLQSCDIACPSSHPYLRYAEIIEEELDEGVPGQRYIWPGRPADGTGSCKAGDDAQYIYGDDEGSSSGCVISEYVELTDGRTVPIYSGCSRTEFGEPKGTLRVIEYIVTEHPETCHFYCYDRL